MERASGARLLRSSYPFSYTVPVRYGDLDTQGHVNNVAMVSLLEDARSRFLIEIGISTIRRGGSTVTIGGGQLVTAAAHYEYLAQAFYPGMVEVHCATLDVRRSSFLTTQLATQKGVSVAVCAAVFALTDGVSAVALGSELRDALAGTFLPKSDS